MERHLTSVECMIVRETMLRQEKIYREQVQALHDLYEVQKSLMEELSARGIWGKPNGNPPQHHQFFPLREEPKKVSRGFDLEKLPDENVDCELELQPRQPDLGCNLELVLHCGSGDVGKRPRLDVKPPVPASQIEMPSRNHRQWTRDEVGSQKQATTSSGVFQLEVPYELGQIPSKASLNYWEDTKAACSGRFGSTGFSTPAVFSGREQDLRTDFWYGYQQLAGMQQSSQFFPHPWQLSGGTYFNGLASSRLPVTFDGTANGLSDSLFSFATKRYTDGLQQAEKQQRHARFKNGCDYAAALSYSVTNPAVVQDLNGTIGSHSYRDSYRNSTGTKTCGQLETMLAAMEGQNTSYGTLADQPTEEKGGEDEGDEVAKLAASILVSLTLDRTHCDEKESSPSLKDSVAWFADAIPTGGMDVDENAAKGETSTSPELDHFESATLQLKAIDESEHIPVKRVEPEPAIRSGRNKPSTTATGRPTRSGKKQRDFRNNTLPSITSLSRQEITEDWQIMSGLLRSNDGSTSATQMRRNGKFCSIARMEGTTNSRMTSPVSTLDHYNCPSKTTRRPPSVSDTPAAGAALPWLVRWGESTRRKRQQRPRSTTPVSQKLKLFTANSKSRR